MPRCLRTWERVPLSGVTMMWPVGVSAAMLSRSEPTPGSMTQTKTVPAGQ